MSGRPLSGRPDILGAFVVFSGTLNDNMEVLAVEGSFASVLGGAPAAAVVFTGEVDKRTARDPRVKELDAALSAADGVEAAHLRVELAATRSSVRSEKLVEVAAQFEGINNCYGECAVAWQPVLTAGPPQATGAVRADLLGTVQHADGSTQVTYGGHPLYFYAHEGAGQVLCHDVVENGGRWLVVTPEGTRGPV